MRFLQYCSFTTFRCYSYNLILAKQPLADAIHYNNHDIIKLLEKHGAKHSVSLLNIFVVHTV